MAPCRPPYRCIEATYVRTHARLESTAGLSEEVMELSGSGEGEGEAGDWHVERTNKRSANGRSVMGTDDFALRTYA